MQTSPLAFHLLVEPFLTCPWYACSRYLAIVSNWDSHMLLEIPMFCFGQMQRKQGTCGSISLKIVNKKPIRIFHLHRNRQRVPTLHLSLYRFNAIVLVIFPTPGLLSFTVWMLIAPRLPTRWQTWKIILHSLLQQPDINEILYLDF